MECGSARSLRDFAGLRVRTSGEVARGRFEMKNKEKRRICGERKQRRKDRGKGDGIPLGTFMLGELLVPR